jgi:hypothetical protein
MLRESGKSKKPVIAKNTQHRRPLVLLKESSTIAAYTQSQIKTSCSSVEPALAFAYSLAEIIRFSAAADRHPDVLVLRNTSP